MVRTGSRVGLIRARLIGARAASGPVLVFLDAHVEASPGWAVPLLAELAGDRSRVALPVIDTISDRHFGYAPQPDDHERGGMDWKMMHFWVGARGARGLAGKKQEDTDAFPSATMIGRGLLLSKDILKTLQNVSCFYPIFKYYLMTTDDFPHFFSPKAVPSQWIVSFSMPPVRTTTR